MIHLSSLWTIVSEGDTDITRAGQVRDNSNLGETDENYFKKVTNINAGNAETEKEHS